MTSGVYVRTEEYRKKLSQSMKGHSVSEKTRSKISLRRIKYFENETNRQKLSEKLKNKSRKKGWHHSELTKLKISKAKKGKVVISEAQRKRLSELYKGAKKSKEFCEKIARAMLLRNLNPEFHKKMSELQKEKWKRMTSEKRRQLGEKISLAWKKGKYKVNFPSQKYDDGIGNKLRTLPEIKLANAFQELFNEGKYKTIDNLPYHYEKVAILNDGSWVYPDFTMTKSSKTARIEFTGAFYDVMLNHAVERGRKIKQSFPNDVYIIITYPQNVEKFLNANCCDKVIGVNV